MPVSISDQDLYRLSGKMKEADKEKNKPPDSFQEAWEIFCWTSMIGLTKLTEAQIMNVHDLLCKKNVFNREKMASTATSKWIKSAQNVLEKALEDSSGLQAGAMKVFSKEHFLRQIHEIMVIGAEDGRLSVSQWLEEHPGFLSKLKSISDEEIKNCIAEIASSSKGVYGMGFTRATLFFYHYGLGDSVSACSHQIKEYLNDAQGKDYSDYKSMESWALINNDIGKIVEKYNEQDSSITTRHVDQSIWIMYQIANVLNPYKGKRIRSEDIMRFIEMESLSARQLFDIIFDISKSEEWSKRFKRYIE